ncbi:histidinol dehydrogenase [Virgibacillus sp. W0181]|uniref:histidinol dehydrogenase n=1 Tax=Virgibacillus sp. W0181 TaxID=3391581 RepID=UPI003F466E3F
MKIITYNQYQNQVTTENDALTQSIDDTVLEIINHVRKTGDKALFHYAKTLDHVDLDQLLVTKEEFLEAENQVDKSFIAALTEAKENITFFHEAQKENSWFVHKDNGIMLGQQITPMDKVGIYVPGGKAAYPSTVLMNSIPAKIAGVPSIAMTTPPQANGKINPHVLVAASLAGIDRVYKIGGAQAIAALAYGTESVAKVDKIVGPGNAYVARAKKWVFGDVAIDMIAGPSEICVVADESANAHYIAADLLSQAEHDEQATAICITTSPALAEKVKDEVEKQMNMLERKEIIQASINQNGRIIIADSLEEAFQLVNELAPEHLQLMIQQATDYLSYVRHAGAIFLGHYSPEPLGDYLAGPNHTLPTSGTAKFASPLGVYDFTKKSSIINYSKEALLDASESIVTLAEMEGLTAHANSIKVRKK